jgi:hypothetical protein
MTHTITYKSDTSTLEIKYQGDVNMNDVRKIYINAAQMVKEHNCHLIFSDYREATIKLSTLEIYDLPIVLSGILSQFEISVYKLKRAFVVAKDLQDYHFYETVTLNQGQNARIFQDIVEAKEWLSKK